MGIKAVIPSYLRPLTANREAVDVNGCTVSECLHDLTRQFPAIEKTLFSKNGKLHIDVSIYVNGKDAYAEGLAKRVEDGDELQILYVLGGG